VIAKDVSMENLGTSRFRHHQVRLVSGLTLHLVERPGVGTPVILVHGLWSNWETWLPLLECGTDPFPERPLYLLDLRGHGTSDKPDQGYTLADYAADLIAIVKWIDAPRVTFVGHSLGALTAIAATQTFPECLEAVILEEPPLPIPTPQDELDGFWTGFAEALYTTLALRHLPFAAIVAELTTRYPEMTRDAVEETARRIEATPEGVLTTLLTDDFGGLELAARAGAVAAPALVFQGALPDQRGLTDDGIVMLRAIYPRLDVRVIPETGHSVHSAAPELYAEAVRHFLEQSRTGSVGGGNPVDAPAT
jgi:pimeloyl-ACP methyl ester carboxylesterase